MGDSMTINERLFEEMQKRNVKAVDIANHLNINKTVISAWKRRGTNPPAEYIEQICVLLDVTVQYLITGKEAADLTAEEQKLLEAYRTASPGIQEATKKLLDVKETFTNDLGKSSNSQTG